MREHLFDREEHRVELLSSAVRIDQLAQDRQAPASDHLRVVSLRDRKQPGDAAPSSAVGM